MAARYRNFVITLGDDFSRRINLVPGPDSDIEGWFGGFYIFDDAKNIILSATSEEENGMLSTHNGYIVVDIPASVVDEVDISGLGRTGSAYEPSNNDEEQKSVSGKLANYYIRVISPSGARYRILNGQVVFQE